VYRVAAHTGVFAANVAVNKKLGRDAIELFADLLAKTLQGMPCAAHGGLDLVVVQGALELAWQGLAFGLTLDAAGAWGAGLLFGEVFGAVFRFGFFNEQLSISNTFNRLALRLANT
jgi:hypothetical protein